MIHFYCEKKGDGNVVLTKITLLKIFLVHDIVSGIQRLIQDWRLEARGLLLLLLVFFFLKTHQMSIDVRMLGFFHMR